jgi:hypothetical protein
MKYYPGNTLTSFVTRLQKTITLTGDWEVALSEFQFPRSWYTIRQSGILFLTQRDDIKADDGTVTEKGYNTMISLPGGYYKTIPDIVNELNSCIKKILGGVWKAAEASWPVLKYDEISKRVGLLQPKKSSLQLYEPLISILGIGSRLHDLRNTTDFTITKNGVDVADVNGGIHGPYVYCDLAESIPVGDVEAPLCA